MYSRYSFYPKMSGFKKRLYMYLQLYNPGIGYVILYVLCKRTPARLYNSLSDIDLPVIELNVPLINDLISLSLPTVQIINIGIMLMYIDYGFLDSWPFQNVYIKYWNKWRFLDQICALYKRYIEMESKVKCMFILFYEKNGHTMDEYVILYDVQLLYKSSKSYGRLRLIRIVSWVSNFLVFKIDRNCNFVGLLHHPKWLTLFRIILHHISIFYNTYV